MTPDRGPYREGRDFAADAKRSAYRYERLKRWHRSQQYFVLSVIVTVFAIVPGSTGVALGVIAAQTSIDTRWNHGGLGQACKLDASCDADLECKRESRDKWICVPSSKPPFECVTINAPASAALLDQVGVLRVAQPDGQGRLLTCQDIVRWKATDFDR